MAKWIFLGAWLLGVLAALVTGSSYEDSEVKSLPGFEEHNPVSDPVVLWLNGGPGCSSFDGWVYEHGPFNFIPGKTAKDLPTLERNPYAWSKVANILYVDSPAGVGLSYTNDFICSDLKTGKDMHIFLQKWFQKFSHFQRNEFFIAGESYAGIYVPVVAREVAEGIEAGIEPKINFKGYYIGNGCTDDEYDGNAIVPFIAGHGLISFELQEKVEEACHGSYWNATERCSEQIDKVYNEVNDLNIYDILEPCFHYPDEATPKSKAQEASGKRATQQGNPIRLPSSFQELGGSNPRALPVRHRMTGRAWPLGYTSRSGRMKLWGELSSDFHVPCVDDRVATVWLNDPQVREALHALPVSDIGPWVLCTISIDYYADAGSMLPIHRNLTQAGYRALIFSGDHDMCVPYTGSERWTSEFGYKIVDEWRPWYVNDQVAGYTQGYEHNLTFATILGAGHTVPEYKPAESLYFHEHFLKNKPL